MAGASSIDTDALLNQAAGGNKFAVERLLDRHRERLLTMVRVRLDRRLAARVGVSDVVQETFLEATRKIEEYLRERPLPFYPWLRQIAWEKIIQQHRFHLYAARRTVTREAAGELDLPEQSAAELAVRLVADHGTSPSAHMMRMELRASVREILMSLSAADREVLVLRYLEELPTQEIAAVLGLTPEAVKTRQRRALERFATLLSNLSTEL